MSDTLFAVLMVTVLFLWALWGLYYTARFMLGDDD